MFSEDLLVLSMSSFLPPWMVYLRLRLVKKREWVTMMVVETGPTSVSQVLCRGDEDDVPEPRTTRETGRTS